MLADIGYKMFIPFVETFQQQGFTNIDTTQPVVQTLEEQLSRNKQFFYVADLIQIKILLTSQYVRDFYGVNPEDAEPSIYFTSTHPDDLARHSMSRSKYLKMGTDLFAERKGESFLSTSFRIKNVSGNYVNLLFQAYLFYTEIPYRTVFAIMIHTDVTSILSIKKRYHYHIGKDPSFFRYPDLKLLMTGSVYSIREFEIIKCIAEGLDSSQIAEKLFLSVHTINTHRRNILHKTGQRTTHDLVIELKERGVI
jgi:DNA-binding CsgD family transcriptional regulator